MPTLGITKTQDSFKSITEKLNAAISKPLESREQIQTVLNDLTQVVHEIETLWLSISPDMNALDVRRAHMHGRICIHVKDSLLHGLWTEWAVKNYTQSIRTLEKWMEIARSRVAIQYAPLGKEKVHQLTKIEPLLNDKQKRFEDLFQDCGLSAQFQQYTCKEFERGVNIILNKQTLQELDIAVPNDSLRKLTENFCLIKNDHNILSRLAEAKNEEANLEKTVDNIVATGGGKRTATKRKTSKLKVDINNLAKDFITNFQEAISNENTLNDIDQNRILFIAKLIEEYFKIKKQMSK